ncbi:helix-turn-helix domain-containing protein [Cytobacillus sp. Hm23]
MESIGKIIKIYRQRRALSQSELAKGICSVSYLSKIENEKIESSREILNLLLDRLKYRAAYEKATNSVEDIRRKLREVHYEMFINPASAKLLESKIFELLEDSSRTLDSSMHVYCNIISLRFYILTNQGKEVQSLEKELDSVYSQMSNENKILFSLYKCHFHLNQSNFQIAMNSVDRCLQLLKLFNVEEWIEGYTYYLYALSSYNLYKTYRCIYYTEKSLAIFKEAFNLNRSLDCYLLLGVSYMRLKEFSLALNAYDKCEKLANQNNNSKILAKIFHNKALINEDIGNVEDSIKLLEKCIEIKQEYDDKSLILSVITLLKLYFRSGHLDLCREGLNEMKEHPFYAAVQTEFRLLEELCKAKETEVIDEKLIKKWLNELKDSNKWKSYSDYAEWIAKYYENKQQYKMSSYYFQQAYDALKNAN